MKFPKWVPHEIKDWFGRAKGDPKAIYVRLVTDYAMREVWEWYSAGRPHNIVRLFKGFSMDTGEAIVVEEETPSPVQLLIKMTHGTWVPNKPSDMTPKAREAYLSKVKKHALALIELLRDTRYDRSIFDDAGEIYKSAKPLDREKLEGKIINDIRGMISWCREEYCYLQADYVVDENGDVYKRGPFYPESDLVRTLENLAEWASKDDYFDILHSVRHIRQSGIQAQKTLYLAKLDQNFEQLGIRVPIKHYATAANVALDLPEHEYLDEESARKQLHRIRQRIEQE